MSSPKAASGAPDQPGYAELQPFDEMRSFLGKQVKVTLDYEDPKATQTGVLHHIDEWGEVRIKDDEGVMHYAWPCLRVEAAGE